MFISMQAPDQTKDQITGRLARSHAVKQALENMRKRQQQSRDNFRVMTLKNKLSPKRLINTRTCTPTQTVPIFSLSSGTLDPFQKLTVRCTRLQTLLSNGRLPLVAEN